MSVILRSLLVTALVMVLLGLATLLLGRTAAAAGAAIFLLLIPIPNWTVAVLLWRAAGRHPRLEILKVVADRAALIALGSTMIGLVSAGFLLRLNLGAAWFLLVAGVVLPSLGSLIWLYDYYRGRL